MVMPIHPCPLKDYKLLSIVYNAKERVLEVKLSATNSLSNLSPWQVIKGCVKEETRRVETHLLLGKVVGEEKESVEEIWHLIVYDAILHWS